MNSGGSPAQQPMQKSFLATVTRFRSRIQSLSARAWLGIVLLVALLMRLALLLLYQPVSYSDTPSYRRLAEAVLGGFQSYDGTRTPGYPVFIALIGSDESLWLAQMALGVLVTWLLFYLGWRLTNQPWLGGLAALAHTLNLGQLFFEANLLTETLTTFWLTLALAGLFNVWERSGERPLWLISCIGLASACALLSRPLFIYFPFWLAIFIVFERYLARHPTLPSSNHHAAARTLTSLTLFLLPVVLLVGGWVLFIHERYGDWSLTTMTGYHLVQHTGDYFEYVPDEYADLRDTYIRFRDAHIAEYGTQANTIWEAIPELQRVSGLSFYDLSRALARISIHLIREHPGLFLMNVAEGWWLFWRAPIYWSAQSLHLSWMTGGIEVVIIIERALLMVANFVFILASLLYFILLVIPKSRLPARLPTGFSRISLRQKTWFPLLLAGNIWVASIVQSLLDHGDNPRFLVPLQSLVILWLIWFLWQVFARQTE